MTRMGKVCKYICPHCDTRMSQIRYYVHREKYYDKSTHIWVKKYQSKPAELNVVPGSGNLHCNLKIQPGQAAGISSEPQNGLLDSRDAPFQLLDGILSLDGAKSECPGDSEMKSSMQDYIGAETGRIIGVGFIFAYS